MNQISRLSDLELETRLKKMVTQERKLLHIILEHIREVDTRRLYLERAYSSIFEYLVKELGYSNSAAMRRLEAARLLKEIPSVGQKIHEGSLNLSQIGELSRAIKEKERETGQKVSVLKKESLVAVISGKSTQETQQQLCVSLDIAIKEQERKRVQKDESVRLEMTLSKDLYQKLLRCRDLAAARLQQDNKEPSLASVIQVLADQYLKQKVGKAYFSAASAGNSVATAKEGSRAGEEVGSVIGEKEDSAAGREVEFVGDLKMERKIEGLSRKLRQKILSRDRCCQYVDLRSWKKCQSSFALQVDHRTSQWAGGKHLENNLQILCGAHNRMKYRKEAQLRFV